MDITDRLDKPEQAGRESVAAHPLVDAFESFVSASVDAPAARLSQARLVAALTLCGFLAAAAAPVAVFAGYSLSYALLPVLLGAGSLAAAAATAATGRPRAVLLVMMAPCALAGALGAGAHEAPVTSIAIAAATVAALMLVRWVGRGRAGMREEAAARAERRAESDLAESLCPRRFLALDVQGRLAAPAGAADQLGLRVGDRFVECIHLRDRLAFLTAVDRVRSEGGRAVCEVRTVAGPVVGAAVFQLTLAAHPAAGTVLVALEDRTAVAAARLELGAALEAAQAASAAKSQLLASVSHELRTPLNAIIGFTDILEQEIFGSFQSPRQKEYVGLIQRSGEHLLHVVNGLLDIAKIEAGRYDLVPERFDIDQVIRSAADMVTCDAEKKGLRLVLKRTPTEAALFSADRRALQQILLNLLSNAVKFTASGTITVSARLEGGLQILTVGDTGIGIDAADIDRIAHPFVQLAADAASEQRGSGLGLSLVKGLCELHRGRLDIASRRGAGTVVTVTIPADCAERLGRPDNPNEKIVALNDARRKSTTPSQVQDSRRTA